MTVLERNSILFAILFCILNWIPVQVISQNLQYAHLYTNKNSTILNNLVVNSVGDEIFCRYTNGSAKLSPDWNNPNFEVEQNHDVFIICQHPDATFKWYTQFTGGATVELCNGLAIGEKDAVFVLLLSLRSDSIQIKNTKSSKTIFPPKSKQNSSFYL